MNTTIIGTSTVNYSFDGRIEDAIFEPLISIKPDKKVLSKLKAMHVSRTNPEDVRENAERVMAHWFMGMQTFIDELEGYDRERFTMKSKVLECERYPGRSQIRQCKIEFSIEELPNFIGESLVDSSR